MATDFDLHAYLHKFLISNPLTWVKASSDIIRWYVPSLGVLVGDALLPVRQIPVVPVQIPTVKLRTPIPHVVKSVYTIVWRIQIGYIIQGAGTAALLGVM